MTTYSIVVTILTEMQEALQSQMEYSANELQEFLEDSTPEIMVGMARFVTMTAVVKVRLVGLAEFVTGDWTTHTGKFSNADTGNTN